MIDLSFMGVIWSKMLEKTLKEVIASANKSLIQAERARLVLKIAKELGIEPQQIVTAELKWI